MDGDTSEGGESPTSILKKHKNKKKDVSSGVVVHSRPFKLLFTQKKDIGRSYVSLVKPMGLGSTLTPKFYIKENERVSNEDVERVYKQISQKFTDGPREKYPEPILDSHNYGWHHNVKLTATEPQDRRFNHGIRDSHLVKTQIHILATDKKTGATIRK